MQFIIVCLVYDCANHLISCEDAAQQVLMSVCLCVCPSIKWTFLGSLRFNRSSIGCFGFPRVPECSRRLQNARRSMSLNKVPRAYMKFHELACSFMSLYAVPFFVWAAHKNFAVLVDQKRPIVFCHKTGQGVRASVTFVTLFWFFGSVKELKVSQCLSVRSFVRPSVRS